MRYTSFVALTAALLLAHNPAAIAQTVPAVGPVQLVDVKPTIKKKDVSVGAGNRATYQQSRSLTILVRNGLKQPLSGVVVRWGIVKADLKAGKETAYGKDETIDLKPLETKTIETATVNASGRRWNYRAPEGEKITGHGVRVLVGGQVVGELFTPPSAKAAFENLKPVATSE